MGIRMTAVMMGLLLLGSAGALLGQTYEWTGADGVVHFTDNPEMVPRKYKGSVRIRESVGNSGEERVPMPKAAAPASVPHAGEALFGGKPYSWWKGRYQALVAEREKAVTRLEELKVKEIAAKRKKLILQRAIDRAAVKEADKQIADQEELVKGIDARIAELESDAVKARVPVGWKEAAPP